MRRPAAADPGLVNPSRLKTLKDTDQDPTFHALVGLILCECCAGVAGALAAAALSDQRPGSARRKPVFREQHAMQHHRVAQPAASDTLQATINQHGGGTRCALPPKGRCAPRVRQHICGSALRGGVGCGIEDRQLARSSRCGLRVIRQPADRGRGCGAGIVAVRFAGAACGGLPRHGWGAAAGSGVVGRVCRPAGHSYSCGTGVVQPQRCSAE